MSPVPSWCRCLFISVLYFFAHCFFLCDVVRFLFSEMHVIHTNTLCPWTNQCLSPFVIQAYFLFRPSCQFHDLYVLYTYINMFPNLCAVSLTTRLCFTVTHFFLSFFLHCMQTDWTFSIYSHFCHAVMLYAKHGFLFDSTIHQFNKTRVFKSD